MKMKCPEGMTSVSFDGETFKPNKKGIVNVPHTALEALSAHGLVAVPDVKPAEGAGEGEGGGEGDGGGDGSDVDDDGEEGAQ